MRASEVKVGTMLAGGERVIVVKHIGQTVHVRTRVGDGPVLRHQYAMNTVVPTPDNPHPGQYQKGHPWALHKSVPRR